MGAEAVPWIVNVYCCNGSVLHVVQIGCSKVWCQGSCLFGPVVHMYVEMC